MTLLPMLTTKAFFGRRRDEPVAQLRDVDKSVLLYSQIDKAAKCRYVVDDAVQLKSGLQVMYILDAVVKLHHLDRCTRVASGLLQFKEYVGFGFSYSFSSAK